VTHVADHTQSAPRLLALYLFILQLTAAAASSGAHAQAQGDDSSRAAARQLGAQGVEAFWANDFTTANDKLDRAFRLFATPTLGLWSGRARLKLGQLVEAAERFREATRPSTMGDSEAQKKAQAEARQELDSLSPRIPSLTVQVQNAEASTVVVTLDGNPIPSALIGEPRPTNPGPHDLVARRGDEHYERHVALVDGDQKRVGFRFQDAIARAADVPVEPEPTDDGGPVDLADGREAAPRTAHSAQRAGSTRASSQDGSAILKPLGIVAVSLGAAGLITSGVTYLVARNKLKGCSDRMCEPDVKDSYDTVKAISTVSLYAGAALAVGGVVLLLVAPGEEKATAGLKLKVGVHPQGAVLQGVF
jgi:hypothetical protein